VFLAKTAKAKFSFLGENSKNEALVFRRKAAKAKLIANSGQREKNTCRQIRAYYLWLSL